MKKSPLVSINIPTLNSERTIKICLDGVKNQSYKNIELILIDSFSTDKTVEIAKQYGAKIYLQKGLIKQRMLGVEKSKGDFILLLDSDQVMDKDLIKKCVEKINAGYNTLILPEKSVHDNSLISRLIAYNMFVVQADKDVNYGTALPRFIKSSYLKKIGSVPEELGYFDHAFIYNEILKIGAKVDYVNTIIYHHELNSWLKVIRKFYKQYGLSFIPSLKYSKKLIVGRSLPRRAFFSKTAFNNPLLWLGLIFLYGLKATASCIGVLDYVLFNKFR